MQDLKRHINTLGYSDGCYDKLVRFYELLAEYNEKFNITAVIEKSEVEYKHFIDSLAAVERIKGRVADIGAGGGFPSIPLAVLRNDLSFTLIDSLKKRIDFLNVVIKELELKNTTAIHSRAEDLSKTELFDTITARAVARLNVLCEYCLPFVKKGGEFIAYKSADAETEITEAKNALKILGGEIVKIENKNYIYKGEEFTRNLIIIKKTGDTPKMYPRSGNKPRSSPL